MSDKKIFYGGHFLDNYDALSVSGSLKGKLITGGKYVKSFESHIKKMIKSKYTLSCSNGTAALFLAFKAIDLRPGDNIIMPAINFISSYSMANELGAKIFLSDVNKRTGQLSPQNIEDCIHKNKLKKIKAIISMYLGGYVVNNIELYKLNRKLGCYLIEDACHALGARYSFRGKKYYIGSCKHSDISIFSFHPVKSITTGEGGLISTNSKILYKKIASFRNHGIKRNINKYWDYDIPTLGYNFRLSDVNCSLGISQLKKLKKFLYKRKKLYKYYLYKTKKFTKFISIYNYKNLDHAFHLMLAKINLNNLKTNKSELIKYFIKKNIFLHYHYKPIYRFSFFKKKISKKNYIGAENFYKNTVSLPIFYNLSNKDIDYIFKIFRKFIVYKKI